MVFTERDYILYAFLRQPLLLPYSGRRKTASLTDFKKRIPCRAISSGPANCSLQSPEYPHPIDMVISKNTPVAGTAAEMDEEVRGQGDFNAFKTHPPKTGRKQEDAFFFHIGKPHVVRGSVLHGFTSPPEFSSGPWWQRPLQQQ